tara:strand:+ start:231 stop:728 length:498 start_codon:yes stop_codon:yes gene_type:complete
MSYKQKQGRGNSPKTGNGLPSPFCQTTSPLNQELPKKKTLANMNSEKEYTPELGAAIEAQGRRNKFLKGVENVAKKDSTSAYGKRIKEGGTKFSAGLQGNLAANKTRQNAGAWDLTVDRGKSVGSGGTLGNGNTSYTRRKPTVEQDVPMARNKDGRMDLAKNRRK